MLVTCRCLRRSSDRSGGVMSKTRVAAGASRLGVVDYIFCGAVAAEAGAPNIRTTFYQRVWISWRSFSDARVAARLHRASAALGWRTLVGTPRRLAASAASSALPPPPPPPPRRRLRLLHLAAAASASASPTHGERPWAERPCGPSDLGQSVRGLSDHVVRATVGRASVG